MYAKIENNSIIKYPVSLQEIKSAYKDTSFQAEVSENTLNSLGYYTIFPVYRASLDFTQNLVEDTPEYYDGIWHQKFSAVPATDAEIFDRLETKKRDVKLLRDQLLLNSDWTQVADSPADKVKWAEYRQELRNITLQSAYPLIVTWPTPP